MNPYQQYAEAKAQWIASHPGATPEQVEAAAREIAERLGL